MNAIGDDEAREEDIIALKERSDLAIADARSSVMFLKEDPTHTFCSDLVAGAYKAMGLLPTDYPPNTNYVPRDFVGDDIPLLCNAQLTQPERVK